MIPYRLGLQQRVFPAYRAAFFDLLACACGGGMSVFAGEPMGDEALGQEGVLECARLMPARNFYLGKGPLLTVWQFGLLNWLDHYQPDVLIADTNLRNVTTAAALTWMHRRDRPVIGWGLGAPLARNPVSRFFSAPRDRFLRRFDALIAYSSTGVEQFAAAGYPREWIFLAPNAVSARPTHPPPLRPLDFSGGRATLLFVGRLQARKRVDSLLRACAALPSELQPRLLITGDGPEREALEALARRIYPIAQFTGDRRGTELLELYALADLFVLPGTGGLAVQEAMAHGLPVVVAEADGTQANLVRPENGWLLPPGDEQALRQALAQAISDPARLRRMGEESYRIVDEEVNLEGMVEVFVEVIQRVAPKT